MTELISEWGSDPFKRGRPTPQLIKAYETWGQGGLGVILSGRIASFFVRAYHQQGIFLCTANIWKNREMLSSTMN